jgi:hypothetical protein
MTSYLATDSTDSNLRNPWLPIETTARLVGESLDQLNIGIKSLEQIEYFWHQQDR